MKTSHLKILNAQTVAGIIMLLVMCCSGVSVAQQKEVVAAATPKGIFVYLGPDIPKDSFYELEVKNDRGNYNKLVTVKAPQNQTEMMTRLDEHMNYLENIDALTKGEKDRMWNYISRSSRMDSLYVPNLPLMHIACGTGYLHREAVNGKDYQYRVKLFRPDGTLTNQGESNTVRMPAPSPDILKPQFKTKQESRQQVMLQWFVPEQRKLSSYNVFRRVYGQGAFQKAPVIKGFNTHIDSVIFIVIDTAFHDYAYYEYYLLPLDAYGNPGQPSDPVGAGNLGSTYIPALRSFNASSTEKDHEIKLSWHFDTKKYLRSLEIHRSMYFDSGFEKVAEVPPTDTTLLDYVTQGGENYYYYMIINGPSGKSQPSAVISVLYRDTAKPEPPTEIAAETIDKGVTVHWTYEEPFVKGFFVYRSMFPDKDFNIISPLIPYEAKLLSYADTSSVLSGNQPYYYAIEAVSDSDVSSAPSVAASGLPGVKTIVSPPHNVQTRWTNGAIMVTWDGQPDSESDLLGYSIYRKETAGEFQIVYETTEGSPLNYFQDVEVQPGKTYWYAVQAKDLFGGKSSLIESAGFDVPFVRPRSPSRPVLSGTREGIHVTWGQFVPANLLNLKLYRVESGQPAKLITVLDKEQLDFLDKSVERGKLYSYYLTTTNKSNIESNPGELATMRY